MPALVLRPVVLTGRHIRLEPLGWHHCPGLFASCGGDEEVWRWLPAPTPRTPQDLAAILDPLVARAGDGDGVSFAVMCRDGGPPIGMAGYRASNVRHENTELAALMIARPYWHTGVSSEATALLLGHAFDDLRMRRVFWRTDRRNARTIAFNEGMGACFEGTHRCDVRLPDGTFRDSRYYSVLREEWPTVRARLTARSLRQSGPSGRPS